jgi:hypothetical protein
MRQNPKPPRRRLDRKDVISFEEATTRQSVPRNVDAIRRQLVIRNYVRMHRLGGDVAWLKRTLRRMGLNPEDWSTYL